MADYLERLELLERKLKALTEKQEGISLEMRQLKREINTLREAENETAVHIEKADTDVMEPIRVAPAMIPGSSPSAVNKNLERFIGENLAGRVGIIVLIIGVAIGIKYAIDHQFVGPAMRLVLGSIGGVVIVGLGLFLKKKYHHFSAILVSGGLAILYLMVFSAYALYHFIPQGIAFTGMFLITATVVWMAILFDLVVVAHIGLIGAYIIPFLVSNNTGNVLFLFSYIAIINLGMLVLAWYRNWVSTQIVAFIATWFIFIVSASIKIGDDGFLMPALFFSTLYYLIFYLSFIIHQVHREYKFSLPNVVLILSNTFLAYLTGRWLLNDADMFRGYSGFFTLLHAVPHLLLAMYIYRSRLSDSRLVYLVLGLFFVFVSIYIPVHFDGNWVTLLWIGEAAMLFIVGQFRNISLFTRISYPLHIIAILSLLQDWYYRYVDMHYVSSGTDNVFSNISFLSGIFFCAVSFSMALVIILKPGDDGSLQRRLDFARIWGSTFVILFLTILQESQLFFNKIFEARMGPNLFKQEEFRMFWSVIYMMLFFGVYEWLIAPIVKFTFTKQFGLVGSVLGLLAFLFFGLWTLSELRVDGSFDLVKPFYSHSWRYIGITIYAAVLALIIWHLRRFFAEHRDQLLMAYTFLAISILWIGSSEVIHYLSISGARNLYGFGLSIWWAVFASAAIATGILLRQRYLRILAFGWFGITLLKLAMFDTRGMQNGPKTILYIVLGILLLMVSYLYNRFKDRLFGKNIS